MSHLAIAITCLGLVLYALCITALPTALPTTLDLSRAKRQATGCNSQWLEHKVDAHCIILAGFQTPNVNNTKLVNATCQLTAAYSLLRTQGSTENDTLQADLKNYLSKLCQQVSSQQSHTLFGAWHMF